MALRNYKAVNVSELVRFAANSRTHSKEQIAKIIRSIDEFGFTNPLLIDENNMIIAGHGRLEAALAIGMQVVPCIELPGLSEAQKAALVIADNKIALDAGWDMKILLDQFEFLKGQDFDLTLTGFGDDELLDLFPPSEVEAFCDENDLPANHKTRSEYGDVWLLGNHRLVCGDSTCATDVAKLLNDQHPNTMITDPPYGVKLDQSWRDKALGNKALGKGNNLVIDNDDRADWFDTYSLFPGNIAYVWHATSFTDLVKKNLQDCGFDVRQMIIWNKSVMVMGRSAYHWKHEPCWYAVRKSHDANWMGDRKQTTVWDAASPNHIMSGSKEDKTNHPSQKPVILFETPILNHTNPGEYVYDPFGGSGTLMIACEKTNRRALIMELDPKYCDVIIQRYENYTGKKAIREMTNGETKEREGETT